MFGVPDKAENTPVSIICIHPLKSVSFRILLIHRLILPVELQKISCKRLQILMLRLLKQIPIELPCLAPLPKLCEILPHKEQLLARMSHHKRIADFQIRILVKTKPRHFI